MSDTAPNIPVTEFLVLPEALSELTRRVVRKARLWPSERRELTAELESHFREGLIELAQNGASLEESVGILRDEFGDPDLAAKLIHRSKKRGRPMIWKIFATTVLVFTAVAAAGGGYLAYVSFGTPTPTVDYIAKINEPLQKVPEGDRAWPVLRTALLQFRPLPRELAATQKNLPRSGGPLWPEALAWVKSNRPVVPILTEASLKPTYGYVYDNKLTVEFMRERARAIGESFEEPAAGNDPLVPPTLSVLLPHLSVLRDVGRFLVLDARDHLSRGEFAEAWQSLDVAHRLGALLFSGQTIIEQLVGVALISMSTNEMRSVLRQSGDTLTAEQIAVVRSSHLATMPLCAIKGDFRKEMFFFNDIVQYVFTDDGNGNGHLIPSQFAKLTVYGLPPEDTRNMVGDAGHLATAAVHADRRDTVAKYHELWDKMEELYSLPLYDPRRAEAIRVVEHCKDDVSFGQRFALISFILPSLSKADLMVREAAMNELATRTLAAILQFRLDHGTLPQRLGELAPAYVESVPIDIYSGMHLRYSVDGGEFKLYSVGGNLQDDGGSSKKTKDGASPVQREDIVFWPPVE